ncbi:putative uncharacterized protein DDB_G0290521 isoform X3 [Oncorhynchus keta]|uniref:putative uncharacterized protein DDB_G0290521 isoform X3 n=1 Tax=Oncorhynchus keta TaxID=8018 RepID=UPI00227CD47D|nr:putative uncharacterized protein DDB_G0290521 isoform X3 [Oncorhynchus keta]
MDVERGPPVSSPEPPNDGDPCPPTDNPVPTPSPTPTPTTGQPQTRSTPIHPTQPCLTQPTSQLRNGAKPHTHTPHTHTPHCIHTANTHASHPNGVRNGGPHDRPAPNSLPMAASSSSSCSSSGMKNPKKLQSNPSITSQSSKRSKSSSKSNSSQIPIEAQDDCCVHCILNNSPSLPQTVVFTVSYITLLLFLRLLCSVYPE